MNLSFLKRNPHRVLEVKKGNNTAEYYPQERDGLFSWKNIRNYMSAANSDYVFSNIKEANDVLYRKLKRERAELTVGTETHPFNEVFHKLSSNDSNSNNNDTMEDTSGPTGGGGFV